MGVEFFLQAPGPGQEPVVHFRGVVLVELVHLVVDGVQVGKGGVQEVDQVHPGRNVDVLVQIADLGVFLPLDPPGDR